MILSVDPGSKGCGLALWGKGELLRAWYAKGCVEEWADAVHYRVDDAPHYGAQFCLPDVKELVIERPQVYVQWRQKGDPNDLVGIALVAGEVAGCLRARGASHVTYYLPSEWKKQLKKEVTTLRVRAALTSAELARVEMPSAVKTLGHNVYDAVGIGLHHLKRRGVL